tara:strand:- start:417 stop:905 length:489 start_codon:yes stop_codon:yes gene_type:complete
MEILLKNINFSFQIVLFIFLSLIIFFSSNPQPIKSNDEDFIKESLTKYFIEVDKKNTEEMLTFFELPLIMNFESKQPLYLKNNSEVMEVFDTWKNSGKANFLKTNIDKIEYTEVYNDFMWVADVTYSRLNTKDVVLSTNRSLYYFVKKDRWKIYMITSVELE